MGELFLDILQVSLLGSLSAAALLVLRRPLCRLVGHSVVYYLWLLVLLRLCIPAGITLKLPPAFAAGMQQAAGENQEQAAGEGGVQAAGKNQEQAAGEGGVQTAGEGGVRAARGDGEQADGKNQEQPAEMVSDALQKDQVLSSARQEHSPENEAEQADARRYKMTHLRSAGALIWGIGVLVCFGWYIWTGLRFSRKVRQSASEASAQALAVLRELDPTGRVGLAETSIVRTPMVLGILHPVIILPSSMGRKTPDGMQTQEAAYSDGKEKQAEWEQLLKDILAHELIHVRRADLVYKWLVIAAASLHWFHPMMRRIRREIDACCELSCDESVIRGMDAAGRRHYGETLLAMAGAPSSGKLLAASLCEEKTQLKERLCSIAAYRKKGVSAALFSALLLLAAGGCASVANVQADTADNSKMQTENETQTKKETQTQNDTQVTKETQTKNKTQMENKTQTEKQVQAAGQEQGREQSAGQQQTTRQQDAAADDYYAVLTGQKQLQYYSQQSDLVKTVDIVHVPDLFSPSSENAKIDGFAVIDMDGDGEQEVLLQITDVAGDMGGYLLLRREQGEVHGYDGSYKTFNMLKADGTFTYISLAVPDTGIGSVRFHDKGYSILPLADRHTSEDFETVTYEVGQQQATLEEYEDAMERQKEKTDAPWYPFSDEMIQKLLLGDSGNAEYDVQKEPQAEEEQELCYEKDGRQYTLVPDLVTGEYLWASVLSEGTSIKDRHGKQTDYYSQERSFESLDGKRSYSVRRWDNLLYSAGEYLIFEYDGMIHISKHENLYHPVCSYPMGRTYGMITKVLHGYMVADAKSYEIRFYNEQFRETQVKTGLRAGESGHYYENGLMAVRDMDTGLVGFMDEQGTLVIPCKYAAASDFSNGYASVLVDAEVVPYTEDAGTVQMFSAKGGQWGILDRKGQFVLRPSERYANQSKGHREEKYYGGIRRFSAVREDGTVDFLAADQDERILETISVE